MQNLFEFSPLIIGAIPLTTGLVQVAKGTGLPSKLAPLCSLAIGVALMFLVAPLGDIVWQSAIIQGLLAGLAASGLYSGGKTTAEALQV